MVKTLFVVATCVCVWVRVGFGVVAFIKPLFGKLVMLSNQPPNNNKSQTIHQQSCVVFSYIPQDHNNAKQFRQMDIIALSLSKVEMCVCVWVGQKELVQQIQFVMRITIY